MGTHSRIGIEMPDHTVVSVYCHWDGYPEYTGKMLVGKMLVKYYHDREDVEDLVDGGSMSSLRTRSTWGTGSMLRDEDGEIICDSEGFHMYENDREPQPLYYIERGEDEPPSHTSFDAFVRGMCGEEYAYLYDLNGNWKAYKIGDRAGIVDRVEIPGYVTA